MYLKCDYRNDISNKKLQNLNDVSILADIERIAHL